MKKSIFVLFLLFLVTAITFGQVDTTTVHHEATQSALAWLKGQWTEHMWTIITLAFAVVSEWLGNTGKVKEGSIVAWILNLIGNWIAKKDVVKTKKAKFMESKDLVLIAKSKGLVLKTLIMVLLFSGLAITISAQSKWDGFLKPSKSNVTIEKMLTTKDITANSWFPRPVVNVSAIKVEYDRATKTTSSSSFSQAGFGLGYQHFVMVNGEPYNNYGFNGLFLIGTDLGEAVKAEYSLAATFDTMKLFSIGLGWNLTTKNPFGLFNISYSF